MIAIAFLCIGLLLLYLEFYTPGGVFAVAGIISMIFSIGFFMMSSSSVLNTVLFIVLALLLVAAVIWLALYRIKKSASANTFYLEQDQEGYFAAAFDAALIGKKGIASTDLGPSGFIIIDGIRYQARSRGVYIDRGHIVEVIGGDGAHIIVKEEK